MQNQRTRRSRRPRPRRAVILRWGTAVVVVALAASALYAAVAVQRIPTITVQLPGSDSGRTYLLVGSDSRERLNQARRRDYADRKQASGERADLLLLLRVPEHGAPSVVSMPRDLYVGGASGQPHRLGLALQGGAQQLVRSLCRELGVGVDHVLLVDFDGLIDLVDAVGGVRVTTKAPTRDPQARLFLDRAGAHQLDGEAALAWVRSRHPEMRIGSEWVPDPAADPSRTAHAAEVLEQVAQKAARSPLALHRSVWATGPHLRRDEGLGAAGLAALAWDLHAVLEDGRVGAVPARITGTEVPFAFPTAATHRALTPYRSTRCSQEQSATP